MQFSAGKNIPLTDYLSRHPIAHDSGTERSYAHDKKEAEKELVIHQIYGLFEFSRTDGSITQHINRPSSVPKSDQSRHSIQTCEQTKNLPRNNNKPANSDNFKINSPSKSKMDKVNGIDLEFIFKKKGHSPETSRFRSERNKILQPNKTRIVRRGPTTNVCKNSALPNKAEERLNGSMS